MTDTTSIRVCIVEDDEWLRQNLGAHIAKEPKLKLLNGYPSAEKALCGIPDDKPNVVVMDINLDKMTGIECVRKLKETLPETQFLMLTAYEDSDQVFDSLLAGASGYLVKPSSEKEITDSILQAFAGGSPMSGHIARKVVQYFNRAGETAAEVEKLSPREKEILGKLAQGASYKEIASDLGLAVDTVRMHIKGVYRKLHVHSRSEATTKFFRRVR
jgi:DNA-binding NarL/FixJ family response regulator